MNQHRLLFELDRVASRFRLLRFWQLLAAAWVVAFLAGLVLWALKFGTGALPSPALPLLATGALLLAGFGIWRATSSARDYRWVARQIETAFPDLRTCLLAAVEQRPDLPDGRFGYLQSSVIHQALHHADRHEWREVVPLKQIAAAALANVVAFVLFILVLAAIALTVGPASSAAALAGLKPSFSGGGFSVTVEPGDTEIERGASLLILARIKGHMPPEATLVFRPQGGEESRLAMTSSLDDPVFGSRIPVVDMPLDYHVELGNQKSKQFHVKVFEYPRLERADARLVYPSYTKLEPRLVQDVRTVSVVEGTDLTLTCYLNKAVKSAILTEDKQAPITLTPVKGDQPAYQMSLKCEQTRRLRLELIDEEGRKNNKQALFTINVLPNQPVTLKPTARDLEVSPLEELEVKATALDDFGIERYGLSYSVSDQPPVEVVLGSQAAPRQKHELAHMIRLEELKAQPDDLISYHFWAEDFAADGKLRRTESDMYFAEVRPFEEVFRQGEPPPGGQQPGQGGNAQQAQQLAQLQKEIMNATWKLIRREVGSTLTSAFKPDVENVRLSQTAALEQAGELAGRVQDQESQEHVENVLKAMQEAITQLSAAEAGPAAAPLMPAFKAEQAAYQALLKLRAREHNVVRQRQRSASRGGQRSQQQRFQMQQLDLQNEENRYETQRMAQDQQDTPEERENRQVLNRLRELAQRQHDVNERLKELQTALEEARTEEQRDELKRQLQRLQDEQRQILQDTEELQSRLETPENLERMANEREQLQQTREQVQRASEALDQSRVTQAAASGTRAEQNFEELRNEFRRRASGRFSEEMQQMREQARELDEKEQSLKERLTQTAQPEAKSKNKSLRESGEREELVNELGQQRQRLGNLQERMRQTIQDAEQDEPLLAEKLYDAVRQAQDQNLERALEAAERSLRQGLTQDAQQQEEPAGRGISQLRQSVDAAAESVLGDETEALRRAREELESLSGELNEEINRNSPNGQRPGQRQSAPAGTKPGPGEPTKGEPSDQPGNQPSEAQPDQQQQQDQQQQGGGKKGGQKGGQKGDQQGQSGQKGKGGQQESSAGTKSGPGEQPGNEQTNEQNGQQPGGQQPNGKRGGRQAGQRNGNRRLGGENAQDNVGGGEGFGNERMFAPLTGQNFREWSDRLRDVEEMVSDPELRAEAARLRERARSIRAEFLRHSTLPNWDLVQSQLAGPLVELRNRVAIELLRRTAKQAIVPLDRDPVPPKYSETTRLYYERLGSGVPASGSTENSSPRSTP